MLSSFSEAFSACVKATILILTTPKRLGLCIIPWALGAVIWLLTFWGLIEFKDSILPTGTYDGLMSYGLDTIFYPLALLISGILAIPFVLIINEVTVEWLILGLLEDCEINDKKPLGRSVAGAFIDLFLRLMVIVPLSIIVFFIGLIPVVGIVALIPSAFLIGLTLYDYPLCLFDLSFKERLSRAFDDWQAVVSLGGLFSISFLVPAGSIIFLPLGYAASVLLIKSSQQRLYSLKEQGTLQRSKLSR